MIFTKSSRKVRRSLLLVVVGSLLGLPSPCEAELSSTDGKHMGIIQIPGLSTIYEVENAARASYMRRQAMTSADRRWLGQITDERWAHLPPEYAWLRDWKRV